MAEKSHGDGGLRRVRRGRGVKKEEWVWANVIWWTASGVRMGGKRVLVWETGLFDRLDFLGET